MSVITVSNLTFGYDSRENIFENLSFQIDTSWRLGFIGRNGKGKTTLLKLLMGEYEYSGRISAGVQIEYFPYKVRNNELPARGAQRDCGGGGGLALRAGAQYAGDGSFVFDAGI